MSEKINIQIDGKDCSVDPEKTLLENALDCGVEIPHLCFDKDLESYGGCGLCVVEIEGSRKPLRACSVAVSEGMKVITSTPALEKSRRTALSLILSDHGGDCKAPCFYACPTHQEIQGYIGLIADGREKEALELIKKDNPLPASIGRVCPHPCEQKCRRSYLEGPVSICALKRFAADCFPDQVPITAKPNGKKIAVVGAGPAGLSCAYFLLLKGFSVDVFESEAKAGGMLRYGIPAYRLPKEVLDREIGGIEKMGAVFHFEKRLGRDITVQSLKKAYDAVFVAVGAWSGSPLHCAGDDAEGLFSGIDLLYRVAGGEKPDLGKNVAVVGGGNTAIDCVRTAVRLGAEKVTLIYRRTEAEMPAEQEEIDDARAEGVQFKFLVSPAEVLTENGRAVGLKLQYMALGEPDSSGRRKPVPVEGKTEEIRYSAIISAIGQRVVGAGLEGLELTAKGTLAADETTYQTSVPGVFAAGDVINKGPDIAVRAIAGGKFAARSMECSLNGIEVPPELPQYSVNDSFDPAVLEGTAKIERAKQKLVPAEKRRHDFNAASLTFTKEEAEKEASRCLECGCAAVYDCKLLPLMRQYDSWELPLSGFRIQYKKDQSHPFIVRDNNKCILCAMCVRACREIGKEENLGLFGRGFPTEPRCAFDLPLAESKCISCGACVSVCPTGALTSKVPAVKNPALPFTENDWVCTLCGRGCSFTERKVNGRSVKLLPKDLRKSCSAGIFAKPAAENLPENAGEAKEKALLLRINGSLSYFDGDPKGFASFEAIRSLLR